METDIVLLMIKQTLTIMGKISLIMIIPTLIVGLLIAILQAATQINEASLTFVPKIIVLFFVCMYFGNVILDTLVTFTKEIFLSIAVIAGS